MVKKSLVPAENNFKMEEGLRRCLRFTSVQVSGMPVNRRASAAIFSRDGSFSAGADVGPIGLPGATKPKKRSQGTGGGPLGPA
jgi:hypothetical protein